MAEIALEIENRLNLRRGQVLADFGVGLDPLGEFAPCLPDLHGRALHQPVGRVPGQALVDQGQEQRLGEDQAPGQPKIGGHVLRVDLEIFEEPGNPGQHEIQEHGGIRRDDPLHRGVADVPLVPQGHVFQGRQGVAPEHPGQAAEVFRQDGVALVGHGRRAFLAGGEHLLRLPHLGALQVADLQGHFFDAGADQGQGEKVFGMPVPLNDLGGNGGGFKFQTLADPGLHLRGQVGEGAHGAGNFAHRDIFPGRGQADPLPRKLGVPQGEL